MAGNMPGKIVAAAITAGGIGGRFTGSEIAGKIRCPFPMIHGAADPIVSPESSLALQQALDRNRVENKRVAFDGIGHNVQVRDPRSGDAALCSDEQRCNKLRGKQTGGPG
jgi:pimeloyl-ACP methyl ester carboxylesterase